MKIYCLRFDHMGHGDTIVRNSASTCKEQAEMWLSDRIENGEAFRGEYVALIPHNQYEAEHGREVHLPGRGF